MGDVTECAMQRLQWSQGIGAEREIPPHYIDEWGSCDWGSGGGEKPNNYMAYDACSTMIALETGPVRTRFQCDLCATAVAYKSRPFQPPRDPLKPGTARMDSNTIPDSMKSLYRKDFVQHPMHGNRLRTTKKRKEYIIPAPSARLQTTYKHDYTEPKLGHTAPYKPNQVFAPPVVRFKAQTEYQKAYEGYKPELAKVCRPALIKPVENIEVSKNTGEKNASTCQNDYQAHSNVERPKPIIPPENKIQPEGPFEGDTMYMANYAKKPMPPPPKLLVKVDTNKQPPFVAVSTFMADYKHHQNVRREASCRPPEAKVTVADVPFAKETTVSSTYKPWPVPPKVIPSWAKKAEYKGSGGKLVLSTTYMMDFKKPSSDNSPATPQIPKGAGESIISPNRTDAKGDATTIYKGSYSAWENARPASPFTVKRIYEPPKEKMLFESTQRSHYRGEHTKRAEICRHVSEHRRLDVDKGMCFRTTYQDTYTGPATHNVIRPKSSPSSLKSTKAAVRLSQNVTPSKPARNLNVSNDSGIDVGPSSPKTSD